MRRAEVPHEAYADAVLRELDRKAADLEGRTLRSVFFGGGTPSLWEPAQLGRVLAAIRARFGAAGQDVEVTVECNPTSLDAARASALREVGVDRLSIGVQSLDEERLRFLGRLHDPSGALSAVRAAVHVGVPRVSADLMFGMPGQRADTFALEARRLVETGVEHVSAYALTVEPDTQFGALHRKGRLQLAPDEDYARTFERAEEVFGQLGLDHYEVSNYARPGAESRHNLHYWRGGDYLGLGAGAVQTLSRGSTARRTKNEPHPERYLAGAAGARIEVFEERLGPAERVQEALMLGLRTRDGVDLEALRARTGLDPLEGRSRALERRLERGDVTLRGGRLRVPRDRWLQLDGIVADLF